jgi:Family of unknown function (DUF6093)
MPGLPGRGGLPAGRALHERWEANHRPTAEQFMTAKVAIRRHSSDGDFDGTTGRTTYPTPSTVWAGWARLQRRSQMQGDRQIGDRQVVIGGVVVSVPASAAQVQIGDELQVLAYRDTDSGDPHLVDRPLWVHEVRPGSLLWQRDLVALDAPPTSR